MTQIPAPATGTDIPGTIAAEEVDTWTDDVDVAVIGFGISGGSAALEASRAGASVILLERAAEYGGTSSMAGGHFYLGGGTPVQQAVGVDDTADDMYDYLMAVTREVDDETAAKIRNFANDSVEHFTWIEALGMRFERSFYPHKAVIQPGTEGLMFTGNEKVWPYKHMARPAPRGHKVPKPGDTGGAKIVLDAMADRVAETTIDVHYETGATHLVMDGDRVVGVAWRRFDERGVIRAKAVVIAAGGYVGNEAMVKAYTPELAEKLFPLASTYDDGLGLRLGKSAGGHWRMMDQPFITAPFYPPERLVTGIVVNKNGERFVAEDSYHARTSGMVMRQPDRTAYLIVDSEHIEHPELPLCPFIDGWETIAEMETALGIPEGALEKTLTEYNKHAADGEDPEFHKSAEWLEPQDRGPWGAYDMSLGKALYAGFTMGGLQVDRDGRVQREDDSVIEGLYAAGACAVNIAQDGLGYSSGTQLAEGSYFGRRAGRHAAAL